MATPSAILSVLLSADTAAATATLTKYDAQLAAVNDKARKGIETRLSGAFNPEAFTKYEAALSKASQRAKDRSAFKAELGANFNSRAFNQYQRAVEKASVETKVAGEETKRTSGAFAGLGRTAFGVVAGLAGVSFGLAAISRSSLDVADKFGQSMEQLHTQAGASQKQVEELSKTVADMTTSVGTGPKDLADGMYHVVSSLNATLPPAKRVSTEMNALKVAAEGAKVGNANLVDVTNALDAAVVSGIGGTKDMTKAMGALNAIVGAGDMKMQDLADALSTGLLGPMKTFGVSLTDIGGALAVFGDNNIRGRDAATKLISAVRIMAAPSKAAAKELGGIGLSTLQLANDMRSGGIVKALTDLKSHLQESGDSAAQQGLVIARAFGGKQSTGVQLLLGQLDRLKAKTKEVGDGAGTFGEAWKATTETTAFKLAQLRATVERIGLVIGQALVPLLPYLVAAAKAVAGFVDQMRTGQGAGGQFMDVLKHIGGVIGGFVGWIRNMVSEFQRANPLVVAAVGALAGMVVVLLAVKLAFVAVAIAQALFIAPWVVIVAAIGAVIGALVLLYLKVGVVHNFILGAWQTMQNVANTVWPAVASAAVSAFNTIARIFGPIIAAIIAGFQSLGPTIGPLMKALGNIFQAGVTVIKAAFAPMIATMKIVGGLAVPLLVDTFKTAWNALKPIMAGIAGLVSATFKIIKGLIEVFSGVFTLDFAKMWKGVKDIFGGAVDALKTMLTNFVKAAIAIITGAWQGMFNAGKYILGGIGDGFKAAFDAVWGVITGFVNKIIDVIDIIPGVNIKHIGGGGAKAGQFDTATGPATFKPPPGIPVAGHAKGGMVKQLGYFAGEEGSQHPEVILATNPAYRPRNLRLFAQAGKMLGVPGFAQGGTFGQDEQLWTAAGGPANLAPIMAAIAQAESGGRDIIQQGQPYATTGWGRWQITPGNSEPQFGVDQALLVPINNARAAVAKWQSGGLGQWTTYTSGAYKQFLGGAGGGNSGGILGGILGALGSVASGALGGLESAVSLGVNGIKGLLPSIPKLPGWITGLPGKLIDKAVSFIESKVGGLFSGGSGGGPSGGSFSPGQLGTFQGLQVADWIIPELIYAQKHGWTGHITSGYRGGFDAHAPSGSEHALDVYPGGAVDFGGMVDPAGLANKLAFMAATAGYKGLRLLPAQGFRDDGHMSGTGHRTGGIYPASYAGAFAKGGAVTANSPTMAIFGENGPETAMFIPRFAGGGISAAGSALLGGFGATAAAAAPTIQSITGMPALPALGGQTPTTIEGAARVQGSITGLRSQIDGLEHNYSILDQYFSLSTDAFVDPNTGELNQPAINKRLAQLDQLIKIRQQVFRAWQRVVALTQRLIASNRAIIERLRRTLAGIKTQGLRGDALSAAQKHQTDTRTAISKYQGNLVSALGDLTSASNDRDSSWISLLQTQGERASVAGTVAAPVVAQAASVDTGGGVGVSPDPSVALLQQLLVTANQTTAVSQAQYKVLAGMPPYGGSFAQGGIVPGPAGSPRTIIAHGGEPVGMVTPEVHVHFANGMDWLRQFVSVEVVKSNRGEARRGARGLPGSR